MTVDRIDPEAIEGAPEDINLLVCVACGRTDRYVPLPARSYHYRNGQRCYGDVVTLTYRRMGDSDD
jgi:hypothetical protein